MRKESRNVKSVYEGGMVEQHMCHHAISSEDLCNSSKCFGSAEPALPIDDPTTRKRLRLERDPGGVRPSAFSLHFYVNKGLISFEIIFMSPFGASCGAPRNWLHSR